MKRWLLLLWLLLPLPLIVWHFGPGQRWLARDRAGALIRRATVAEAELNWTNAAELYRDALGQIGGDPSARLRLELALVRTQFRQGAGVEAIDGVNRLLADASLKTQPAAVQREARELAGRIHYYAAWVMRLEGAQRDLWMEEAESARQNFRLLTETSAAAGHTAFAQAQQTNLEGAIQLERLSLTELMARPLPQEGQGFANQALSEQMARRRGQRGNQPGTGENEEGPPASGAGTTRFPGAPGS